MAKKSEIVEKIENTRNEISDTIDEIGKVMHEKFDIKTRVEKNPYSSLLIAAGVGFAFATISTPLAKNVVKILTNSAKSTLMTYISQKGLNYFTQAVNKIK